MQSAIDGIYAETMNTIKTLLHYKGDLVVLYIDSGWVSSEVLAGSSPLISDL